MKIGSINIPHVTVADDLSSVQFEAQVMVWEVEDNAGSEIVFVIRSKKHNLKHP